MKVALLGQGAFARKHLEAIRNIDDVDVVAVLGRRQDAVSAFAVEWGIPFATTDLDALLALPAIEAVLITSPTQVHAEQAIAALRAGKHVMVEIPMADTLADARAIVAAQQVSGRVAMAGHTRRFNPSHQWLQRRFAAGDLRLQQLDVQTYFFRRTNTNALGEARSWTDHLLWHHACHTVDLFQYQSGAPVTQSFALQGPVHPQLGIALDMSIGLKTAAGSLCTLSLSFNNDGPLGTFFRYICDKGTYIARYDELVDGHGNSIDLSDVAPSNNGIELQDREFFAAIREGREPNASVAQCLGAMEILDRLEQQLV
jgi:2-hydroxy-4-carboxymuconate semialdehyde hemiacetal dehydrogenase